MELSNQKKLGEFCEEIKRLKINMIRPDINTCYGDFHSEKNNFYYNYTHCELHPAMMYGALCSKIPFCNHNQAPRNQYQAAIGKQAIGIFATNYNFHPEELLLNNFQSCH